VPSDFGMLARFDSKREGEEDPTAEFSRTGKSRGTRPRDNSSRRGTGTCHSADERYRTRFATNGRREQVRYEPADFDTLDPLGT